MGSLQEGRHDKFSHRSSHHHHSRRSCRPGHGRAHVLRDARSHAGSPQPGASVRCCYFAAAIWFAERELVGFAEHLRDEAKQEEQHAAKFADYLISRGQRPVLDTVEPPRQQWPDVEQVIANVFRMEADVTASVLQLYGTAEGDDDKRTTVFLDAIVDAQRLSEHEAAYLLGRVKFAAGNPAAVMIIDAELREGEAEPM